ncbi:MAG: protease HtpX [Gammaproteobacteria bacterium]|nr:protease HtpX [Gammaproteobacteria bacterium]
MLRVLLFLGTNLAVIVVASIVLRLLGVDSYLNQSGTGINFTGLLIFSAVFGFSGSLISLLLSKKMALWSTRTQLIEQPTNARERWLLETVQDLARDAGINMPDVGIFPSQQANAFATGWNKNDALVAVSEGLLQRFDEDEARAVMAHEIAHVANGDMVTLALVQGVVNTFVIFISRIIGYLVDRVLLKNERGHGIGFFMTTLVAEIVLGILASTVVMWFSRYREYRADAGSAALNGKVPMIRALKRLQADYERPNELPETLTAFGINRGHVDGFKKLFASHPPIEQRIKALESMN